MSIEQTQVNLRLTTDKKILNEIRKRRGFRKNAQGEECFHLQFDGAEFIFRPGVVITVGANVARFLKRGANVICGADIDGPVECALEEVGRFDINSAPVEKLTVCPLCKKDCQNIPKLSRHLAVAHKTERPDLYKEERRTSASHLYDQPLEGETAEEDAPEPEVATDENAE